MRPIKSLMIIAFALIGSTTAVAQSSNTIIGCYNRSTGDLRRVTSPGDCRPAEDSISWDIVGPQGVQGAPGQQGPQGPAGPKGDPGASCSAVPPLPPAENAIAPGLPKFQATEGDPGTATGWLLTKLHFDRPVIWTPVTGVAPTSNIRYEIGDSPEVFVTVGLRFDTSVRQTDVADLVAPLDRMAAIDANLHRPPMVLLQIGALNVRGVISSISETYSDFLADGTRTRCEVEVKMKVASGAQLR